MSESFGGWRVPIEVLNALVRMGALQVEIDGQERRVKSAEFKGDKIVLALDAPEEPQE